MENTTFDINALNSFDWQLLALVGLSILMGIYRGALRGIINLSILLVSGYVAHIYSKQAGHLLSFIENEVTQQIFGLIMVYLCLVLILMIIKFILLKTFNNDGPGMYDRCMGALFGVLRGCLGIIIVLVGIKLSSHGANLANEDWYKKSVLVGYFQNNVDYVVKNLPQEFKDLLSVRSLTHN